MRTRNACISSFLGIVCFEKRVVETIATDNAKIISVFFEIDCVVIFGDFSNVDVVDIIVDDVVIDNIIIVNCSVVINVIVIF